MQIAGLGAVGTSGVVGGTAVGAASATGSGAAAGLAGTSGVAVNPASTTRLNLLVQLLDGFTTAEVLMALMLAAALSKKDRSDDSSALGVLVGLALASQLQQSLGSQLNLHLSLPSDGLTAAAPTPSWTLNVWA